MDGIGPGKIRGEDISQLTENDYCDVVEQNMRLSMYVYSLTNPLQLIGQSYIYCIRLHNVTK